MESILKTVTTLEGQLIKAIEVAEKTKADNDVVAQKNKELSAELSAKEKDIKAREKAIAPIEDVVVFKLEAEILMREAKNKISEANKAVEALEKQKEEHRLFVASEALRIQKEDERILDEKKGLKRGYEQLKKAEQDSENKVLKGIVNKVVK